MPPPTQTRKIDPAPIPLRPPLTAKCAVRPQDDGTAIVEFRIDAQAFARLKRKMGPQDPAIWLWENLLHRTIEGAAF